MIPQSIQGPPVPPPLAPQWSAHSNFVGEEFNNGYFYSPNQPDTLDCQKQQQHTTFYPSNIYAPNSYDNHIIPHTAVLSRAPSEIPTTSPPKSRYGNSQQRPFRRQDNYRNRNPSFSDNGRTVVQFSQMNNNNNAGFQKTRPDERQQAKVTDEIGLKKSRATSESESGNPKKKIHIVGKPNRAWMATV